MGGLPRRNHIISALNQAGPTISVDAGLSLGPSRGAVRDLQQRRGKAGLIGEALALVHTDAIALGATDWALGTAEIRSIVAKHSLPLLAANLVCDGERPYPASRVIDRGGRRVGIVGITDGAVAGCTVAPARAALQTALAELGEVDLRLALVPLAGPEVTALVGGLELDLVIDANARRIDPAPEDYRGVWALSAGPRGQRVGVLELRWIEGASGWIPGNLISTLEDRVTAQETRLATLKDRVAQRDDGRLDAAVKRSGKTLETARAALEKARSSDSKGHEIVARRDGLDDKVPDHEATARAVEAFVASMDEAAPLALNDLTGPRVGPKGSAFAGSDTCAACHPGIDGHWTATPHATAWKSLVDDGHAADHSCYSCHATGVGQPGGPTTPETVGGLRDVQCEACHGPAAAHVREPAAAAARPMRSPGQEVCVTCHDGERDMGRFDLESYLPKVVHKTPKEASP